MPPVKGKMWSYSQEALRAAVAAVSGGVPVSTAAKRHGVPRVTLLYKVRGKTPLRSAPTGAPSLPIKPLRARTVQFTCSPFRAEERENRYRSSLSVIDPLLELPVVKLQTSHSSRSKSVLTSVSPRAVISDCQVIWELILFLQNTTKGKMSVASVHPASGLSNRSQSFSSFSSTEELSSYLSTEPVLSIEELRLQLNSCFTCGVSWTEDHVSLDCAECGGYSLARPCPTCEGHCSAVWKRDLTMSHACGKARWTGSCGLLAPIQDDVFSSRIAAAPSS
ncbi:hypothetical protein GE061_017169 [Apolygus lucorum]|uniref:HTH psq-type domain-containing protein n=1 Tax=Apolygus lucorum TaxID=248454 RepID=A0A8S9XKA9_APOLU|nr:hypothetical protein GE061_017169 [Apolygus lucorum]